LLNQGNGKPIPSLMILPGVPTFLAGAITFIASTITKVANRPSHYGKRIQLETNGHAVALVYPF
jgi:hypothetical protein